MLGCEDNLVAHIEREVRLTTRLVAQREFTAEANESRERKIGAQPVKLGLTTSWIVGGGE